MLNVSVVVRFWFAFCVVAQFVAPFGAYEALLGTNPIAVGIPREEGKAPVVLDMATAAFPCEYHRRAGGHLFVWSVLVWPSVRTSPLPRTC